MDFSESGPLSLRAPPALAHEVVDVAGVHRERGRRERLVLAIVRVQVRQVVHHLGVGELRERRRAAQVHHLPQGHGEGPHVALGRVLAEEHRLPRHPPDGQRHVLAERVIVRGVKFVVRAKVGDLYFVVVADQAVSETTPATTSKLSH